MCVGGVLSSIRAVPRKHYVFAYAEVTVGVGAIQYRGSEG